MYLPELEGQIFLNIAQNYNTELFKFESYLKNKTRKFYYILLIGTTHFRPLEQKVYTKKEEKRVSHAR